VDTGFACNKTTVFSAAIKERFCTLIRLLILGSIFPKKIPGKCFGFKKEKAVANEG